MLGKIKRVVKRALSSKPVTYKAKVRPLQSMAPKKRTAPRSGMRQYGQKGYRPSTGKGVGY